MTVAEATAIYQSERDKRSSESLPASWTVMQKSRKTQQSLGNGGYLTHIEPAE